MANSIQRDLKKRILYSKYELKRSQYKSLIQDLKLSEETRFQFMLKLNNLSRNSSRVRIKNRCVLTGRGHSVLRLFKISRIKLRELASNGLLVGVRKSTW